MTSVSESSQIRVGDTEREAALKALGEHLSAGRIDIDEYGERSAQVTAARTRADLRGLFADLPEPHPMLGEVSVPLAGATAGQPGTAVAQRPSAGQMARNAAGVVTSLSWVAAIAVMVFVHGAWPVIFLPVALSAVFGSIWGKHWNKDHERDDRERYRRERRGER